MSDQLRIPGFTPSKLEHDQLTRQRALSSTAFNDHIPLERSQGPCFGSAIGHVDVVGQGCAEVRVLDVCPGADDDLEDSRMKING